MAEKTVNAAPPVPASLRHDGAVALRSPDEQGSESACFALGHMLKVRILDVRTGEPIRQGGYIKSCKITLDGETVDYRCPDGERYPPAARHVASYKGHNGQQNAQRARFYRWVSSSLRRLGYFSGAISANFNNSIGAAMRTFYQTATRRTLDKLDHCLEDFHIHLRNALGGRDEVDLEGMLYIGLPEVSHRKTVRIRFEFHDLKFIVQEDVADAAVAAWGQCEDASGVHPRSLSDMAIVYDRAAAAWPTGGADPDHVDHESTVPRSNWCLQVTAAAGGTHKTQFRNFHEWDVVLDRNEPVYAERTIHALTWCQPVWHEELAFLRAGRELSAFRGPSKRRPETAINSLHPSNGASSYNYGVFGLFRSAASGGKTYYRLHTGVDLSGREREGGGHLRTPVFAVNGGRATRYGSNVRLNHRDEQVTRYVHMHAGDLLVASDRWVKAGSLLGKMGRNAIPASYPTHCHFETLIADQTGWSMNNFTELPGGAGKVSAYPRHPGVDTNTSTPKYIKFQYGTWTRDPGAMLAKWIDQQLGGGAAALYRNLMPGSWPAMHTPPCRCEFGAGHTANPSGCTAACRNGSDDLVAAQVQWARQCWAIRTSHDAASCACPGLSQRGLEASFTRVQRIQYHLWQLGFYDGAFNGERTHATLKALQESLAEIHGRYRLAANEPSEFVRLVNTEANRLSARQTPAGPTTAEHLRIAGGNVLRTSANIDLLLTELHQIMR